MLIESIFKRPIQDTYVHSVNLYFHTGASDPLPVSQFHTNPSLPCWIVGILGDREFNPSSTKGTGVKCKVMEAGRLSLLDPYMFSIMITIQ